MEATQNVRGARARVERLDSEGRTNQQAREVMIAAVAAAEEFALDLVKQFAAGKVSIPEMEYAINVHVALADANRNLTAEQMASLYRWTKGKVSYAIKAARRRH